MDYKSLIVEKMHAVIRCKLQEMVDFPERKNGVCIVFNRLFIGVKMSSIAADIEPTEEEMVVVLENEYEDLAVNDFGFSVKVFVDDLPVYVEAPFNAVRVFFDLNENLIINIFAFQNSKNCTLAALGAENEKEDQNTISEIISSKKGENFGILDFIYTFEKALDSLNKRNMKTDLSNNAESERENIGDEDLEDDNENEVGDNAKLIQDIKAKDSGDITDHDGDCNLDNIDERDGKISVVQRENIAEFYRRFLDMQKAMSKLSENELNSVIENEVLKILHTISAIRASDEEKSRDKIFNVDFGRPAATSLDEEENGDNYDLVDLTSEEQEEIIMEAYSNNDEEDDDNEVQNQQDKIVNINTIRNINNSNDSKKKAAKSNREDGKKKVKGDAKEENGKMAIAKKQKKEKDDAGGGAKSLEEGTKKSISMNADNDKSSAKANYKKRKGDQSLSDEELEMLSSNKRLLDERNAKKEEEKDHNKHTDEDDNDAKRGQNEIEISKNNESTAVERTGNENLRKSRGSKKIKEGVITIKDDEDDGDE